MNSVSTWVIVTVGLIVATVGAVDALASEEWDLLAVFLLTIALQLTLWLRFRANRTAVTLRPDLARWLESHSRKTGEPIDDLLDRAVAWYENGLFVDEAPRRSP